MKISIIIPIYKVEKYIERCIKSVIAQTFTDYEIILVDDASPDNALPIAKELLIKNNIVFQTIKHPKNRGLAAARNSGIQAAKGEYLFFIDSDDDLAHKEVLEWFYNAMQEEDYDFVTARINCHEEGKLRPQYHNYYSQKKVLHQVAIIEAWMQAYITNEAWGKLIKADFLRKHQLLFPEGYYYEDLPWIFNLCKYAQKVAVLPHFVYNYYHQYNENAITSSVTEEKIQHLAQHLNYILHEIDQNTNLKNTLSERSVRQLIVGNINFILYNKKIIQYDKTLWIAAYKNFKKIYRNSFLWKRRKKLFLPNNLAYWVIFHPNSSKKFNRNRYVSFIRAILLVSNFRYPDKYSLLKLRQIIALSLTKKRIYFPCKKKD